MKIEKLNKDNIKEFIRDIDTAEEIELNINKLEYYAVKDDDIYLLAFEMLSDEDKISIKYVNNKVKEDKFLDIINYLNNILVVRTHLIIDLYNDKYMDVLSNNYKCKEISHVPGRFCSGVGSFVCVYPAFSNLDTIRSEKRSRRREDEGK